ncbi:nicotinamide riboside transporter PnuC [Sphingomonas sp. BK345]|uniref:nicotinamide riboside transporter PnuC n=1 Tax=Sphingomonas sp. BK345 TaxID=2586980 RepID=UPI001610E62B|nr:nicotinamide riboside transporter PnuC [Sphingomonas sp. BK345]MBB3474579.1 nicotinamide mononucleotide transporter [Sphingomonas sp. BK345]
MCKPLGGAALAWKDRAMSLIEWIATLLGIACVALAARRSVWTFPTAIGSVTLLGAVVFEQRLYSDALLQGFFVLANLYGWATWRRERRRTGEVTVERLGAPARLGWAGASVAAALLWGAAMHRLTDASYPWWDAAIAAASVAAQLLMARRKIENWWLWIAVDLASVPLYLAKQLYLFAALYLVYLALAVIGLAEWRRARHPARALAVPA